MGTPIADLRPSQTVVVEATVDRILREPDHGIDAVVVRVPNAQATARHDADVLVTVLPDEVTEAGRLLHFAAEHARLAEWLVENMGAEVDARMALATAAGTSTDTEAVNLTVDLLLRLRDVEELVRALVNDPTAITPEQAELLAATCRG